MELVMWRLIKPKEYKIVNKTKTPEIYICVFKLSEP